MNNYTYTPPESSLWESLADETRPIVMYGTGNGGDKIFAACERFGIKISAVFASDGFVRNRTFHELPVRSYDDVISTFGGDIVILLAFGTTLAHVRESIKGMSGRHTLIIPDVPLYGGDLFTREVCIENLSSINQALGLLADAESVSLMRELLDFRLTGDMSKLARTQSMTDFLTSHMPAGQVRTIIDGGAFTGDTARELVGIFPQCEQLFAFEPDAYSFKKLQFYSSTDLRIIPVNAALSDKSRTDAYSASGSRGAGRAGRNRRAHAASVTFVSLDGFFGVLTTENVCHTASALLDSENAADTAALRGARSASAVPDFIKLDVEGDEAAALRGARRLIEAAAPSLAVSVYHRTADLWELPLLLARLLPSHRLFLRRADCLPAWDITLYAIRG